MHLIAICPPNCQHVSNFWFQSLVKTEVVLLLFFFRPKILKAWTKPLCIGTLANLGINRLYRI